MPDIDTIRRSFSALSRTGADGRPLVFLDGPRRRAGAGCRDRRHGRLSAALQLEHRRRVRDERGDDRAGRRDARRRGGLPRRAARGDHLRAQHDDDQLQPRALPSAARCEPGDEIVVTALDHDANVSPWLLCAKDHDLVVKVADVRDGDLQVEPSALEQVVGPRTKVCAFTLASNGVGTVPNGRALADVAHSVGALAWMDCVHYAPHRRIDVAGAGRRRADLLAVQVLRAAPGPRLRPRGAARDLARRSRAPGGRAARRPPLRDRDAEPRGARGRPGRDRLRRLARRGRRPPRAPATPHSATSSPTRRGSRPACSTASQRSPA